MTRPAAPLAKGQRFRAYPAYRPADRVFLEVLRVARDRSWADIFACTWAVAWRKRQSLRRGRLPYPAERFDWDRSDLAAQEMDWEARRREPVVEPPSQETT